MEHHTKQLYLPCALAALSGILYGFLGFFGTKVLQENMSLTTMLAWRFAIAGLWILLFNFKKDLLKQLRLIEQSTLIKLFMLGALGYAGSTILYFLATFYTGTGLAMVVFFTYPMAVALFSWIAYKKHISSSVLAMLVIMLIGMFLLQDFSSKSFSIMGLLFAALAGVCYAIYIIGSKQFSSLVMDSKMLTILVCMTCTLIFMSVAICTHCFALPHTTKQWLYLLALGIFATALPIQLLLEALKHISAMRASIISVLEPLMTVLVGIIGLGESVSLLQILGVILILASALLIQVRQEI